MIFEEFEKTFSNDRFLTVGSFSKFEDAKVLETYYDNERLIGFVAIEDFGTRLKDKVGRLSIGILPEYQGKGFGKKLMLHAIQKAFDSGKEKIWLSVYSDNYKAIRLYESLGFIVEGVFRNEEYSEEYGYRDVYSMALFKTPKKEDISWGPPDIGAKEIDNLLKCVKDDWFSSGKQVSTFARNVAKYTNAQFNIPVSNGTTALIAAYSALFEKGDKVIIPNYTFIATYRAAQLLDLDVLLCDVDPRSGMIRLDLAEELLKNDPSIKGLVSVSVAGLPSDYTKLLELKDKYGIYVVEDAAAALGAEGDYKAGEIADITTFSLHASKVITAIEGGLICTNDPYLEEYLRRFITHGEDPYQKYLFSQFGLNLRPTDLNFSIANAQLEKLERYIDRRNQIIQRYRDGLEDIISMQAVPSYVKQHSYMSCLVFVEDKWGLLEAAKSLAKIEMRPSWNSIEQMNFEGADWITKYGVYLPLHNKLTNQEVDMVISFVRNYIKG
jgi:perosamine synthetase